MLSNMFSDNAASNFEVFYLQYCFRQPSEFRISSLHMWLSVRIFWLESIRRCRTSRSELFWLKVQDGELESIRRCRCIAACRGVSCFGSRCKMESSSSIVRLFANLPEFRPRGWPPAASAGHRSNPSLSRGPVPLVHCAGHPATPTARVRYQSETCAIPGHRAPRRAGPCHEPEACLCQDAGSVQKRRSSGNAEQVARRSVMR